MQQVNSWGTSISRICPAHRPRRTAKLITRWLAGAVGLLLCGATPRQEVTVLDLTKPAEFPSSARGYPILGGGGVSGVKIGPDPYPIPLDVRISELEPKTIARQDKFLLEIELKNNGTGVFFFPVSRDVAGVQQDKNEGRRTMLVFIRLEHSPQPNLNVKVIGLLAGSSSLPRSLKRLNPGDSVLVRVTGDLSSYGPSRWWVSAGQKEVTLRAGLSESTLKEGEFAIENVSEKVLSKNTVTLTLKQE